MKGALGDIMKQAQKLQEEMQKKQEELAKQIVEGSSGAGMVTVVMNGKHQIQSITLDDSLMSEDKPIVQDLIAAAVNDAVNKVAESNKDVLSSFAGGLNLPPDFKFPFS